MEIPLEKLKYNSNQKHYKSGFRLVYFYDRYHEVLKNVCVKDINNLAKHCPLNSNNSITTEKILDAFLKLNKEALAVAIYDIKTGKEIKRKYKKNVRIIEDYVMFREELMYDNDVENFIDGYRLVYFYPNNNYTVGTFSKKIENFMFEFCDMFPIDDESDIPEFVSIEDILERSLNMWPDVEAVAIYKTDGTCILKKERVKRLKII